MKRLFFFVLTLTATLALKAQTADTQQVFIYCPGEQAGLHIAQPSADGWQDIGQLCTSDYGTWGVEKKM